MRTRRIGPCRRGTHVGVMARLLTGGDLDRGRAPTVTSRYWRCSIVDPTTASYFGEVINAYSCWQQAGRPHRDRYGVTISDRDTTSDSHAGAQLGWFPGRPGPADRRQRRTRYSPSR